MKENKYLLQVDIKWEANGLDFASHNELKFSKDTDKDAWCLVRNFLRDGRKNKQEEGQEESLNEKQNREIKLFRYEGEHGKRQIHEGDEQPEPVPEEEYQI
jgi:hypothetical protein